MTPGRIMWVAIRSNGMALGQFEWWANHALAVTQAHRLWGTSVDRVESLVSWEISQEEGRIPEHRRIRDDDETEDCV